MPTTSKGLRYTASSAAPNVPQDIQNLATDVDARLPDNWVQLASTNGAAYDYSPAASWGDLQGFGGFSVTVPTYKTLTVQFRAPAVVVTGGIVNLRLLINSVAYDTAVYSIGSGNVWIPARHEWSLPGTGSSMTVAAQGQRTLGTGTVSAAAGGSVVLRYQIT